MADYRIDGQDSNFHTSSRRTKLLWDFLSGNIMEKEEMFDLYYKAGSIMVQIVSLSI